jgi:mannosyltransferase OCH1-like enzyme
MTIHFLTAGKYQNQEDWPEIWNKCFDSWFKTNYDICLWNDEGVDNLLIEDDKEFLKILNTLPPIYKFDYVRYLILEKYGGAYIDMDVELIEDFFHRLNPEKIYLMDGTRGTYLENSIMISPQNDINCKIWKDMKTFSKNIIIQNFKECSDYYNSIWTSGPGSLSTYFIKHLDQDLPIRSYFDILAWEHFSNPNGTLNFTKHYHISAWLH